MYPNSPDLDPSVKAVATPGAPTEQKPSFWRTLLAGAMNGLAGSAGAKTFGAGAAGGAGGELAAEQRTIENKREDARTQSGIKFKDAQSAAMVASITRQTHEMQLQDEEARRRAETHQLDVAQRLQSMGLGGNYMKVPADAQGGMNYLNSHENGVDVPAGSIPGPNFVLVPQQDGANDPNKAFNFIQKFGPVIGMDPGARGTFMSLTPEQQKSSYDKIHNLIMGNKISGDPLPANEIPGQINWLTRRLDSYKKDPKADPAVADLIQSNIDDLKAREAGNKRYADEQSTRDVAKAAAIAGARADVKNTGALMMGSLADGRQIAGTEDELKAAGAKTITKLPASESGKVIVARQMVAPDGLFHNVSEDIKELEKTNQIGVAASRWADFMSGKVGNGPEFAKLRADMGLLATALMQAHVGSRGSDAMREHFLHLADYRVADAPTLKGALSREFKYVMEKAAYPPKATK
jgi:hypothetical protein